MVNIEIDCNFKLIQLYSIDISNCESTTKKTMIVKNVAQNCLKGFMK